MTTPQVTHLERRKIQAEVLIPLIQAFQQAIGKERANEIAREAILNIARDDGKRWAEQLGDRLGGIERLAREIWAGGGSLEIKELQRSNERFDFNVTRCKYAEFYKELGLPELGTLFHCNRDFAAAEGFSGITLHRTQTIMNGASHCDFRFEQTSIKPEA